MNFVTAGTLHNYTKAMSMQLRWKLKERSGNVSAHPDSLESVQPAVGADDKLKEVMEKVYAGRKLSREEKAYLKEKSPELYAQIEAAEREDKAYEAELKRCRTKEEVQRVKTSHMGAALTRVHDTMHNSAIPKEKKLEILTVEKYRSGRLEARTRKFVRSAEYHQLPTDIEKASAEREERETEEARQDMAQPEPYAAHDNGKKTDNKPESETVKKVRRAKRRTGLAAYEAAVEALPDTFPEIDTEA